MIKGNILQNISDDFRASFQEKNLLKKLIEILDLEIRLAIFLKPLIPSFKTNDPDKDELGFISFSNLQSNFIL